MHYEGESSVVQVIFTKKEIMCVAHPSKSCSATAEISRVWCLFLSGLDSESISGLLLLVCITGAAFSIEGGEQGACLSSYVLPKGLKILVYLTDWTSGSLPVAVQHKRVINNLAQSILSQEHSPQPLIGKKKITWLNRASASMTYPRDWEECLGIEKEGACFTPAAV